MSSLEKRIDETQKKYEETNRLSEERLKKALEADQKLVQLKTAMQRWLLLFFLWIQVGFMQIIVLLNLDISGYLSIWL